MEPTKNGSPKHEATDARLKAVVLLLALTAGLAVVGLVSMWLLFDYTIDRQAREDRPPSPLADTRVPFSGPRLQVSPVQDLKDMQAAEKQVLESYDWVDRDAGRVRIPIEKAMDLVLERGFPVKSSPGSRGAVDQ